MDGRGREDGHQEEDDELYEVARQQPPSVSVAHPVPQFASYEPADEKPSQ